MNSPKRFFIGFRKGTKEFAEDIARVVNSLVLAIVYFGGVALTSIVAKLFGKHFLDTKLDRQAKTYWSDLDLKDRPIQKYYRQF